MRSKTAVHLLLLTLGLALGVQAQNISSANLRGTVKTPSGDPVSNAKIVILDASHNLAREAKSSKDGAYRFSALPPGTYGLTAEADGFRSTEIANLVLTVGQDADLPLVLQSIEDVVHVVINTSSADQLETQRTSSTNTVTRERIDNLPTNGRNYVQFALIDSEVKRDGLAPNPMAPTSGLNFDGARARSNLVPRRPAAQDRARPARPARRGGRAGAPQGKAGAGSRRSARGRSGSCR